MVAYQISVFAENKPGRLAKVTSILAREKINIRAISISSSDDFGVINVMADEPKRALEVLEQEGLTVGLREVVAVLIEDKPGGLDKLIQLLYKEKINIENAYGFVLESWKRAVFVVDVDQMEKTQQILREYGFETLDPEALQAAEPFHYMKY
ncbi:MAG: ACT domain-containing protein [Deltaproteobacteria bacterium]|nr:ACT domain-containing protein [Deltaproteobacteria bacterium]MBN2688656.1 ACT domain-containing protein [Deltaproteobacteria bacterium]